MTDRTHTTFMKRALTEARLAARRNEVPVGAVLIQNGRVIARGHNTTRTKRDPTAHAEMVTLQKAAQRLKNERLVDTILYVTLEPCAMCAGAIIQARVRKVIYGARDPKAGACGSVLKVIPHPKLNHRPTLIGGILAGDSARLLKKFFQKKRRHRQIS